MDLSGWEANVGTDEECFCVGGRDGGLSVECFADENGKLVGVLISRDSETVGMEGYIPAKVVMRELEYVQ